MNQSLIIDCMPQYKENLIVSGYAVLMKKYFAWLKISSLFFFSLFFCFIPVQLKASNQPASPIPVNSIVAIVNNGVVTKSELSTATLEAVNQAKAQGMSLPRDPIEVERQVLQGLIMQKIALQLATLNHITATPDQVDKAISEIAAQNHLSVAALYAKLEKNGVDKLAYQNTIQTQLIVQQLEQQAVAGSIVITPDQVNQYLANQVRLNHAHVQYDVAHILLSFPEQGDAQKEALIEKKAADVLAKIKAGLSFKEAAQRYSDSGDAVTGGDLGFKALDDLPTAFVEPVTHLAVGEVSDLILTDTGYNIIKLVAKKGESPFTQSHYITEYHVQAILMKANPIMSDEQVQAQLQRIRTALENGASFSSLAISNSQDYVTGPNGGDMGWANPLTLNPTLASFIKQTPPNTISPPFQAGDAWYVIQVIGSRATNDTSAYEYAQAQQALFMRKANEALLAWQAQIKAASYVKILDPKLDADYVSSSA